MINLTLDNIYDWSFKYFEDTDIVNLSVSLININIKNLVKTLKNDKIIKISNYLEIKLNIDNFVINKNREIINVDISSSGYDILYINYKKIKVYGNIFNWKFPISYINIDNTCIFGNYNKYDKLTINNREYIFNNNVKIYKSFDLLPEDIRNLSKSDIENILNDNNEYIYVNYDNINIKLPFQIKNHYRRLSITHYKSANNKDDKISMVMIDLKYTSEYAKKIIKKEVI